MKKYILPLLAITTLALVYLYHNSSNQSIKITSPNKIKEVNRTAKQRLKPYLKAIGLSDLPNKISIVAFKSELLLHVYAHIDGKPRFLKSFPFTAYSGDLGPKLKRGDLQIPEGRYTIVLLNPKSKFHLSMKVSYPNDFDREMARMDNRTNLGGDIYIHGKDDTVGCIPIGDKAIEELYLLATYALPNDINVIISPIDFRMNKPPPIKSVSWEETLYADLSNALKEFPLTATDSLNNRYSDILNYTVDPKKGKLHFYSKDYLGKHFLNHGNLNQWLNLQGMGLKFAANGGMFNKDYSPVGLYIENGKTLQKINRKQKGEGNFYLQPNGVFSIIKDHTPQIISSSQFKEGTNIEYATQSGPMLVIDGAIHPQFNAYSKNVHIRNGVGLLPEGRLLFAMSKKQINFYRFAKFFKEHGCRNALYLDGYVSRTYLPSKNWRERDGTFGVIIAEVMKY